jgi:DNA replication factor GINS
MIDHREHLMEKIIINNKSNETKIGFKPKKNEVNEEKTEKTDVKSLNENIPEIEDEKVPNKPKKSSKPKPPILDESQIAMMFGQAPDDTLLDENNNPVKPVKRDITTPFKGPKPPKEDSVTLQNIPEKESETKEETPLEVQEEINDTTIETESKELQLNDVELVEFRKEIFTDILDENEKTYGPFLVDDIVLLPKSIVKILRKNDVIEIIE